MSLITWSEMMSVGVPVLDADHKTLVGLINDLHRSIGDDEEYATLGSVLKALEDYAEHHFAREERVMEVCKYPGLEVHSRMHHRLAAQVRDLKEKYDHDRKAVRARECLDFLNKWLIEHICSTDMDYRAWVVGHAGALVAAESVSMIEAAKNGHSLDWKRLRVLVVDDNRNFCQIMTTILGGVGTTDIKSAYDVETAKSMLPDGGFDVMVTDWQLGQGSGPELIAWARSQPRLTGLPILMLSGHERLANRDVAINAGADEFMEKPISARGLLICLARLLTRKNAA